MAYRLDRIRDHVFHIEINIRQVEVLCDHETLVLNGYRIVDGRAVRPGRIRRISDLHARDRLGDLCHALDHRELKMKTRCLLHRRFSEGRHHRHLLLGECVEAVEGKNGGRKYHHGDRHRKACMLRYPDLSAALLFLVPVFFCLFIYHAFSLVFFSLLCPGKETVECSVLL